MAVFLHLVRQGLWRRALTGTRKRMSNRGSWVVRVLLVVVSLLLIGASSFAVNVKPRSLASSKSKSRSVSENQPALKKMTRLAKSRAPRTRVVRRRHRRYYERFSTSSFAEDVVNGDITDGEDTVVRRAA